MTPPRSSDVVDAVARRVAGRRVRLREKMRMLVRERTDDSGRVRDERGRFVGAFDGGNMTFWVDRDGTVVARNGDTEREAVLGHVTLGPNWRGSA